MQSILSVLRPTWAWLKNNITRGWKWYRGRKRWQQWVIGAVVIAFLIAALAFAHRSPADTTGNQDRTVTLASVGELSGTGGGTSIVGSVRSVTEADLLAEVGGTVQGVHTTLGATVPAGFVIADLDNASEAAAVLQAEGAYDAAVASRNITATQSGNTQTSFTEAQQAARDTYKSSYTTIDSTMRNSVDTFFGANTPTGPQLLISTGLSQDLPQKRRALQDRLDAWRAKVATADNQDPLALLSQATNDTQTISSFLVELAIAANDPSSGATTAQKTSLATARSTVDGQLAALSAARDTYNTKKTAAQVAGNSSSSDDTQLASANAGVKSALGSLRAAQAAYEKTRIRATIGGTVNFLPIKRGQYVNAFEHVATVAQNGALEIVAYVPEDERNSLSVGMKVSIEGGHAGTVTEVAPALDPTTKQIEVHIAVDATPDLVNGQSVRITLPNSEPTATTTAQTTASSTAPKAPTQFLLPLTAVKLLPDSRAVFTVDTNGRLVAHNVTIGDVVSDNIEVLSGLTPDMRIVTDVRGLSEGQKVSVASDS